MRIIGRKKSASRSRHRQTKQSFPLVSESRASSQELNQGRLARREQTKPPAKRLARSFFQRLGLLILLIAVLASVINVVSLTGRPNVVPLSGADNQPLLRPTSEYEQAASRLLKNSIWNRNKLTINTKKISQDMLQQFPELENVSVAVPLVAHRPQVYIEPAHPTIRLVTGNGSYIVDNHGNALAGGTSAIALQLPKLPVLYDQNNIGVELDNQVLSSKDISFIRNVLAQLTAKNYPVADMTLPAATRELHVKLSGQPYYIKFNLQGDDPRGQAGTFIATINGLKRRNIIPSQYVDVRVDGRAYYQ